MKRFYSLFLVLFVTICSIYAESISEEEALTIAQQFWGGNAQKAMGIKAESKALKLTHASKGYYAFNRGEKNGYIIVANDDVVKTPVIGFADNGEFSADNMPENMRWWLSEYEREMEFIKKTNVKSAQKVTKVQSNYAPIEPLLTTLWNQDSPYNDMCPVYNGTRCPTGCVATAMAQVMYHHRWPEVGIGSNSYEWIVNEESQGTLSSNFSEHRYNYDAMEDVYEYDVEYSSASKEAISQFMYDIGIAVNMSYGPGGSGAFSGDAAVALINNFGYDKSAICANRDYYSYDEWLDILYSNLEANQPIYYSGANTNSGHAFVLDGYRDGYFHVNWGWGGVSNGYFLFNSLDPDAQGIGGSTAGYNWGQAAILNVKRPQADSEYTSFFYSDSDFNVTEYGNENDLEMTFSSYANFSFGFWNGSLCTQTISYGIKVEAVNDGEINYIRWHVDPVSLDPNYGYHDYNVPLESFPSESGSYKVTPAYLDANNQWHDIKINQGYRQYVIATVDGENITFSYPTNYFDTSINWSISVEGTCYAGTTKTVNLNMENSGDEEYFGNLVVYLLNKGTTESVSYQLVAANLLAHESQTYNIAFTMPETSGEYDLVLADIEGNILGERYPITVTPMPEGEPVLSLVSQLEMEGTTVVVGENIDIYVNFKCENGYFDGWIGSALLNEDMSAVADNGKVYNTALSIGPGETKRLRLPDGYKTALEVGKTYSVIVVYYRGGWEYLYYGEEYAHVTFTVEDAPQEGTPVLSLTSQLEMAETTITDIENIDVYANLKCENGNYEGYIGAVLLNEDMTEFVDNGIVYHTAFSIGEGETTRVRLPDEYKTLLEVGKTYTVAVVYYYKGKWNYLYFGEERGHVQFTVVSNSGIEDIFADEIGGITEVYTLTGVCLLRQENGKIDMSSFSEGFYLVKKGGTVKCIWNQKR